MDSDNEYEDEYDNGEGQEMNGGEGEEIAANANGAQPRDVGSQYDDYGKDVLGESDNDKDSDGKGRGEKESKGFPHYMFFDFRKCGPTKFPKNVKIVQPSKVEALVEKQSEDAQNYINSKKEKSRAQGKNVSVSFGGDDDAGDEATLDDLLDDQEELLKDLTYETLNDGTKALIVPPGYRLKLDLSDLLIGGDEATEAKEKRDKATAEKNAREKEAKEKKNNNKNGNDDDFGYAEGYDSPLEFGGFEAFDSALFANPWGDSFFNEKEYINEYTITMDIKLLDAPPHNGISLFQTALVHAKEAARSGKITLNRSEGEAIINAEGGLGQFGTYGDVTKARVKEGVWTRITVAVKCVKNESEKSKNKGEMRTWVVTQPGVVLKDEAFAADERFAIDPKNFFLFSSSQNSMMPGKLAIRTIRVEKTFANDAHVHRNRARDKILNVFMAERVKELEKAREGLSLASLFPKPRPVWAAVSFCSYFGDALIENTPMESNDSLAWAYLFLTFAMEKITMQPILQHDQAGFSGVMRGYVSDVVHATRQSVPIFRHMLQLLKKSSENDLLFFLRKVKGHLEDLKEGHSLLLPLMVEGTEMILLVEKSDDRSFRFVIINADATRGLQYHPSTTEKPLGRISYRTCVVLSNVNKKNALDDVFWLGLYSMTTTAMLGDMHRFYDVLVPFLTGKPFETSLVEAENAALHAQDLKKSLDCLRDSAEATEEQVVDAEMEYLYALASSGSWRSPQRSDTAYVRLVIEALHYMLLCKGIPERQVEQVHLALFSEMISMMKQDLTCLNPDENGYRVCSLALQEFCHASSTFIDGLKCDGEASSETVSFVLRENYGLVESVNKILATNSFQLAELPPLLELREPQYSLPEGKERDESHSQYKDLLMWETPRNVPDPGMAVSLDKYIPIDFLQIPRSVKTREEAVTAIRMCDRLCTLVENQEHCVKNGKFLIVSCIEHIMTQVVPIPKPRGVTLSDKDLHKADRAKRIAKKKEQKKKAEEATTDAKKKALQKSSGGASLPKSKSAACLEEEAKKAEDEERKRARDKAAADENLDTSIGEEHVKNGLEAPCIWDAPISYALQVELMLTLTRLMEHFGAATMSMHQSRSFDGVCTIIPGCITAIADTVMRRRAYDEPSVICCQLAGQTVDGVQLGIPGFGINISTFASQCETIELHSAELAVARTAVLDYFQSPAQARLDKLFEWEKDYDLHPDQGLVTYLRNCMREIAYSQPRKEYELVDNSPMMSLLMKNYPELSCFRDIVFYWKFFLNPDRTAFPNYSLEEVVQLKRMAGQLSWRYDDQSHAFSVSALGKDEPLRCRPDPESHDPTTGLKIAQDKLPIHRFPSTATPSFFLPSPAVKTEDDIIYRPNLPDFADRYGQVLSQRDSELLLSYLTAPYIRLPLVLTFFSTEDRIHKLRSKKLRDVLDSVLFEPGKYLHANMTGVEPVLVPTMNPELLSSSYGLLVNDLVRSPKTIIPAIIGLLKGALACDTGSAADTNEDKLNMSTKIILYTTLLGARADNYLSFLVDNATGKHEVIQSRSLRDVDAEEALGVLKEGRATIRELLHVHFRPLLDHYIHRLDTEVDQNPDDETLVDRNARFSCNLNSHKFMIYRNYLEEDMSADVAKTLAGAFVFLVTRHSWNKAENNTSELEVGDRVEANYRGSNTWYSGSIASDSGSGTYTIHYDDGDTETDVKRSHIRLQDKKERPRAGASDMHSEPQMGVPEHELYEAMYVVRRRLINFVTRCKQGVTDEIMQTVMQVSSSQLGTLKGQTNELDAQNRWSKIGGLRSVGRWAVASTRTIAARNDSASDLQDAADGKIAPPKLMRQSSSDNTVAEVGDSSMLGVEIDIQLAQMTLRSKHLMALPSNVASNLDVVHIFGDKTMQVSQLERAEKRKRYKVVSSHFEIQFWNSEHKSCPPVPETWTREYDPAELYETEKWMVSIFEPIRQSFFVQHSPMDPPTMQFMMCEKQTRAEAEVVVLVGLHQAMGNAFKLVYLYRRLRCLHVYEAVSNGQQWYYTMHMSSDARYALAEMPISHDSRKEQYPVWWLNGTGVPYPNGIKRHLASNLAKGTKESVTIIREAEHPSNLSGGSETFVPARLLKGALPDALLDAYDFWQDESEVPRNASDEDRRSALENDYKMLRGYPRKSDVDTVLFVEVRFTGSWLEAPATHVTGSKSSSGSSKAINNPALLRATGFPGRTVSVTRRPKALVEEEFEMNSRVASSLESLRLIQPVDRAAEAKKKKKSEEKKKKVQQGRFKVEASVEVDFAEDGNYAPAIINRVADDGTYDVEFLGAFKWLGIKNGVPAKFVRKKSDAKGHKQTTPWKWEDQSDDEDAIWADLSDLEEDEDEEEASLDRLGFDLFNELPQLLEVCNRDESLCVLALRRIKASNNRVADMHHLIKALRDSPFVKEELPNSLARPAFDRDDMALVDLAYPPKRSDLFALIRVLTRIEVLGQICAWTKLSNEGAKRPGDYVGLESGRPLLDSVELPRLKLEFVARPDHLGEYRLFSVDHGDLFITNVEAKGNDMTEQMVAGIPHSILLSNVKGETQVLVPVVQIQRPNIEAEPFHTFIVRIHNSALALAERYFLYPVHVSLSFLLTKGINSALYLMLLRFLHRDYFDVVRLADSVATDTKFNGEGERILRNFSAASSDWHPDAHACRLKISSVIIDSGNTFPWDLTNECARYAVKIDRVSTACRLSPRDELQLLESDLVATTDQCKAYDKKNHHRYTLAINYNRMHLLRSLLGVPSSGGSGELVEVVVNATVPARQAAGKWPFYTDNTMFGENYAKMLEVQGEKDGEKDGEDSWEANMAGDTSDPDRPVGGWLVLACFHTLWSEASLRLVPQLNEIVPLFHDKMRFLSVRADTLGLTAIARRHQVRDFPTAVLLRGGKEVARLDSKEEGFIEKAMKLIQVHASDDDKMAHAKRRHRLRTEEAAKKEAESASAEGKSAEGSDAKKKDSGDGEDDDEDEDKGQVEWTFDPENSSKSMNVGSNGMVVTRKEDTGDKDDVTWEYTRLHKRGRTKQSFKPFSKHYQARLEKAYKSGDMYTSRTRATALAGFDIFVGSKVEISTYSVSGFTGVFENSEVRMRRVGDRLSVRGEEGHLDERQKREDEIFFTRQRKVNEYRERMREARKGQDVECIRGSYGFTQNTGVHHWEFLWGHCPGREGSADAIGICSDLFESFDTTRAPAIGSGQDNGTSLGLHADGMLIYDGGIIGRATKPTVDEEGRKAVLAKHEEVKKSAPKGLGKSAPVLARGTRVESSENSRRREPRWHKGTVRGMVRNLVDIEYDDGETRRPANRSFVRPLAEDGKPLDPSAAAEGEEKDRYHFAPMSASEAPLLFGKQSLIKCELDTDSEGGLLRYYIDGVRLEQEVRGVFELLGSTELFPIVSMCPLDADPSKDLDMAVEKAAKQAAEGDGDGGGVDADEEDNEALPIVLILPFANSKKEISLSAMMPAKASADRVRWMYETDEGWEVYPVEISRDIHAASEEGKTSYECKQPDSNTQVIKFADNAYQVNGGRPRKVRKHVLSEGVASMWELFISRYEEPPGNMITGAMAAGLLTKVRSHGENMTGKKLNMGFLFLYNLLSGTIKCNVLGSSFMGFGNTGGMTGGTGVGHRPALMGVNPFSALSANRNKSDAFRFGLLLSQFYEDIHSKSLQASIINVLGRNRAVSLRMPRFQDTRKSRNGPYFYGWTDEQNPTSPTSDLFRTVVTTMHNLKRKKCLRFAPPPPYEEMGEPAKKHVLSLSVPSPADSSSGSSSIVGNIPAEIATQVYFDKPEVTDFACESRQLRPVDSTALSRLVESCNYRFGDTFNVNPPIHVEDLQHWTALVQENLDKVLVVDFHATWCKPCQLIAPQYRALALSTPDVVFLKVDVDECPDIALINEVDSMPTIKFFRVHALEVPPGSSLSELPGWVPEDTVLSTEGDTTVPALVKRATLQGAGPEFLSKFDELLRKVMTGPELTRLDAFKTNSPIGDVSEALLGVSADEVLVGNLAQTPLKDCNTHIDGLRRADLGMEPVNPVLAFDLSKHDAAHSMPAKSVLKRFKDDAVAYANSANNKSIARIGRLHDSDVDKFFEEDDGADGLLTARALKAALSNVRALGTRLQKIKASDLQMVKTTLPLLQRAANEVNIVSDHQSEEEKTEKIRFLMRRQAGQNVRVWLEFMFGTLISARGKQDLHGLNPYLADATLDTMLSLVSIVMLRANRLGHLNRCIGAVVALESLLVDLVGRDSSSRLSSRDTMRPRLVQAGEDLAKNVLTGRHYMQSSTTSGSTTKQGAVHYQYDPRYLVFEFVWNIQLRKSQVEIVRDFRASLSTGTSKVKQMIMGAGKTSVVAPLLALIVADGSNLVLSVVPKALVEMSRTRMRETFSAIMTKRIYTLEFDRSTDVKPAMLRGLENAVSSRGIVVATPTTLKSIMLSYLETLQLLEDSELAPEHRKPLASQAQELSKVLGLFKKGVALLDEVDLILHPLKSELNFPIGDKFDLDGSDDGQRWNLPIHIMDAIFFAQTGHYEASENSVAIGILRRISAAIKKGIEKKFMQRLPHLILLNIEYYRAEVLPLVAEWCYLWLQKQHLHGIAQEEAIRFMIQGAAARSESLTKLSLIDLALKRIHVSMGKSSPKVRRTSAHLRSMSQDEQDEWRSEEEGAQMELSLSAKGDVGSYHVLTLQEEALDRARDSADRQAVLIGDICDLNDEIEDKRSVATDTVDGLKAKSAAITQRIHDLECPRDSSLDNSTIVWCSEAFSSVGHSVDTGEAANKGASTAAENSVSAVCAVLEDQGLSVRRCSSADEATAKARELQKEKHLLCVIFGGEEHTATSLGRDLSAVHSQLKGHMETITETKSPTAVQHGAIPITHVAAYAAHAPLKDEHRTELWKLGAHVAEAAGPLVQWVEGRRAKALLDAARGSGSEESKKDDEVEGLTEAEVSMGLSELKAALHELESQKTVTLDEEERTREALQGRVVQCHTALRESVQARSAELTVALEGLQDYYGPHDHLDWALGSANGRDAALACAWLESRRDYLATHASEVSTDAALKACIEGHIVALKSEREFLQRILLAATVVTHVTSPTHKKMLNLCHNWLITYLPHCLAKINRVSFGLLSSEDCKAAVLADPHVPRSRLKMAVPFTGKDVPSKASEFAHPDIIIGLTVLAYRYSGLRRDDYTDILDSLTSSFSKEIGPAKGRPSNLRHQSWVLAAGGSIRGLKTTQDGKPWRYSPTTGQDDKEVVQLIFLQKSNQEQMDKLFSLLRLEPTVIHDYLQRIIFPVHMRSQRMKISASGQAVGGDMLVGCRVGFSGTPSDLLPVELGRCDYATGDDGMMVSTVLDRSVASYQRLPSNWSVEFLLESIATAEPRFNALIDTGALITGYSNEQVARYLLDKGLKWCEGVIFLDEQDKQQVLIRATGRVVSADQCGVSLEKRFAFYDQIHTTGMDIKHVVNATAVITLGKDMVFRDYVQGAYRMRGIGQGQKICVFLIPEVQELILRELRNMTMPEGMPPRGQEGGVDYTLEDVVAWLIVNSLRSEQTQWTMLCLQNIGNIYRKNAFACLHSQSQKRAILAAAAAGDLDSDEGSAESKQADPASVGTGTGTGTGTGKGAHIFDPYANDTFVGSLDGARSLRLFDEKIDFTLAAGVSDPLPFEDKLRSMLEEHAPFIRKEQHETGSQIMEMVGQFSMVDRSANRLDQEQEREQEQEQEKEVEARKDQQIEVEKFVMREYARQEEQQRPWAFSKLAEPLPPHLAVGMDHPFYQLQDFKLRHHQSIAVADNLLLSKNYYNPSWAGLRRLKNVIIVMEFAPSVSGDSIRLKSAGELQASLTPAQEGSLQRAHTLFAFHASQQGRPGVLAKRDLVLAVQSVIDKVPSEELIDSLMAKFSKDGALLTLAEFRSLLTSGELFAQQTGIYYVAVSLAEAETIRKILHVRASNGGPRAKRSEAMRSTGLALRYSQVATPGSSSAGDGGIVFDATKGWHKGTAATPYEASIAHSTFRFFDSDTHFSVTALNILIRCVRGSKKDRLDFFLASSGVRRRLERKWQDTPLAKVFNVADMWVSLEFRALSAYFVEALRARDITFWEAFMAIDHDNTGMLTPPELYGAIKWLDYPSFLTAEDVAEFFEAADTKRDGVIDYKEYMAMVKPELDRVGGQEASMDEERKREGKQAEQEQEQEQDDASTAATGTKALPKVPPYGSEQIREVIIKRRQRAQLAAQEESAKSLLDAAALDVKVFEEELEASKRREGGANPLITLPGAGAGAGTGDCDVDGLSAAVCTHYNFSHNAAPLRFAAKGQCDFLPIHHDSPSVRWRIQSAPKATCRAGHKLSKCHYYYRHTQCHGCNATECSHYCPTCAEDFWYYGKTKEEVRCFLCEDCYLEGRRVTEQRLADPAQNPTFLRVAAGGEFSLQIPTRGGAHSQTGCFLLGLSVRVSKLPVDGAVQGLVKFSANAADSAEARALTHRCSVYLTADGTVVHDPTRYLEAARRREARLEVASKAREGEGKGRIKRMRSRSKADSEKEKGKKGKGKGDGDSDSDESESYDSEDEDEEEEEEEDEDEDEEEEEEDSDDKEEEGTGEHQGLCALLTEQMRAEPAWAPHAEHPVLLPLLATAFLAHDADALAAFRASPGLAADFIPTALRVVQGGLAEHKEAARKAGRALERALQVPRQADKACGEQQEKMARADQARDTAFAALERELFLTGIDSSASASAAGAGSGSGSGSGDGAVLGNLSDAEMPPEDVHSLLRAYRSLFCLFSEQGEEDGDKEEEEEEGEGEGGDDEGNEEEDGEESEEKQRQQEWQQLRALLCDPSAWRASMQAAQAGIPGKCEDELSEVTTECAEQDWWGDDKYPFSAEADIMKALRDWLKAVLASHKASRDIEKSRKDAKKAEEDTPRLRRSAEKGNARCAACAVAGQINALSPLVQPNQWCHISVLVHPAGGTMTTYVNGVLCQKEQGLAPAQLTLHRTFVALGGGERASSKGGDIYDLTIVGAPPSLDEEGVRGEYRRSQARSVAMQTGATKIAALFRGYHQRQVLRRESEEYRLFSEDSACIKALASPTRWDADQEQDSDGDSSDSCMDY